MTVDMPRVLVVSQSRITRRVIEMTFADQPVELVVAITGPAGLAAWDAQPSAVVLADVTMDGTGGLAIAQHVQATAGRRAAAVLLMAGQQDAVDDAANAAADVRGVIHKPLDSLQLIESVREALRTARPPRPAPAVAVVPVETALPAASETVLAAAPEAPALPDPPEAPASSEVPESSEAERLAPAMAAAPEPPAAALDDQDLERVAARVAALWSADARHEARMDALVREMAPALVQEVARLVVADVSERLVREEIARLRSAHAGR